MIPWSPRRATPTATPSLPTLPTAMATPVAIGPLTWPPASEMKITELLAELKQFGLPRTGKKPELVARINAARVGPRKHPNHAHPMTLSSRTSSWRCDGCRRSGEGTRYRCEGTSCDFDFCLPCWVAGFPAEGPGAGSGGESKTRPRSGSRSTGSGSSSDEVKASSILPVTPMTSLCLTATLSDVTLVFAAATEGSATVRVPAHRLILASVSTVFRDLLYASDTPKPERDVSITLATGITVEDFRLFLRIIYGGVSTVSLTQLSTMLQLSATYQAPLVAKHVSSLLSAMTESLSPDSVCALFNSAPSLGVDSKFGLEYIAENATEVVTTAGFRALSKDRLKVLLQSDDLLIEETSLFTAVLQWADAELERMPVKPPGDDAIDQRRALLADVIPLIRLGLLDITEVATLVAPSGALEPQALLQLFAYISLDDEGRRAGSFAYNSTPRGAGSEPLTGITNSARRPVWRDVNGYYYCRYGTCNADRQDLPCRDCETLIRRDGVQVKKGRDKTAKGAYYCGRPVMGSYGDGNCGPNNGNNCEACREVTSLPPSIVPSSSTTKRSSSPAYRR